MIFDLNVLLLLCHMNLGTPAFDYQEGAVRGIKSDTGDIYGNIVTAVDAISANDITKAQDFYGTEPFSWRVAADDYATQQLLSDAGFKERDRWRVEGMELKDIAEQKYADNIRVKEVSPDSQDFLDAYMAAAVEYNFNTESIKNWFEGYWLKRVGREHGHCYVVYHDEKPVGVSTVTDHGIKANLSDCFAAPDYRDKACDYVAAHKALYDAKQRGVQEVWSFSTPLDQAWTKPLGFKEYADYVLYAKE